MHSHTRFIDREDELKELGALAAAPGPKIGLLHGRIRWQRRLQPFDYFDGARMVPWASPRDAARFYAAFGGTPLYLRLIDPSRSFDEAVATHLLSPRGEVRILVESQLDQERGIRNKALYRAVLSAVGRGATTRNQIVTAAAMQDRPHRVRHALDELESLGLIWAERNFAAPSNAPFNYRISDPALAFWHRFVLPNRSFLETSDPVELWAARGRPHLDAYLGRIFERMARQAYVRHHRAWQLPAAAGWARWEGTERARQSIEIDLVARLADGRILAGEVKWSSSPVSPALHYRLRTKLEALASAGQKWAHAAAGDPDARQYAYVSAAGFTEEFRSLAQRDGATRLIALDDMYTGL